MLQNIKCQLMTRLHAVPGPHDTEHGRPEEEQGKQMLPWILQTLVENFDSKY